MEAMASVAVGAVLTTGLPKLWDVITRDHGLMFDIKLHIDYIEAQLPMVNTRIQAHMLHCISPSLEVSQVIQEAHQLAEDTVDCIHRFLLYQTHGHLRFKMSHLQFARQIEGFRKKLEQINKDVFSLEKRPAISLEEPEDSHFGIHPFVGMGVPILEIVELLGCVMPASGEPITKIGKGKLKIISIVGIGGSGKTRLAKKVYEETGEQFGLQAWVDMGLERNVMMVLDEILSKFSAGDSTGVGRLSKDAGTSKGVNEGLKSWLCKERYLIVIDDVRSTKDWDTLLKALPESDVGSRIIVTTTSQIAAKNCSSPGSKVYQMSTLCDADSIQLFTNVSNGDFSEVKQQELLSTVVKTCDGLPLALIESAESFKENRDFEKAIHNLCIPEEGSNGTLTRMQWVVMNRYNGLGSYGARACLLYFHMFPFENLTKSKFLTRQWLAEGLVQKHASNVSDLDAASNYLDTFRDSNIIRSMQLSSNGCVKSCSLPGTMQHFISGQSNSQDFITFLQHRDKPLEGKNMAIRRLSLYDSLVTDVKLDRLRTLAVSGKASEAMMDFANYEVLQVLDLKEWDFHKLGKGKKLQDKLRDICKLIMLKYLGLPGSIGEVPKDIRDLIHLETLDVGETEIVKVHGEVIKLPRLIHLLGMFRLSDQVNPENCVLKDSKLETFSGFVTDKKATFAILMKGMEQLRKVKIWCDFEGDRGEQKHLSAAIKDYIYLASTEPCDRSLSIDLKGCKAEFLQSLEGPGRLSKFKLRGCLEKVPKFLAAQGLNAKLTGVTKLCLSLTTLCGKNPKFPFGLDSNTRLLPSLKYLKLEEDELGPLKIVPMHFPNLEQLCLVSNTTLEGITIEAGALEYLVSLYIMCKAQVGLAGIQIRGLKRLEEIALDSKILSTRDDWKKDAKIHPNQPYVLSIEASSLEQNQVQSVPRRPWYDRFARKLLPGSRKKT